MDIFDKCKNYTVSREVKAMGCYPYFKVIESAQDTEVIIGGKKLIMIGSNNYLGLTNHPKVKEAAKKAIEKYGTGCSGSRFLNGTLDIHEELENRLENFTRKEAVIVFSTGFQANLGAISSLVGKDDIAIIDREDHASIVDGSRLSFGKIVKFKHNDMEDLERILSSAKNYSGKLIVVDGIFSMKGDISNLPRIVELCSQYSARLMVDDAHSFGVLGKNGRGTTEHFGLDDRVDIIMGTFSKSFASLGGFIASSKEVIEYIKHNARSIIFSASMPPAAVASVIASLDIIETESERRKRLWENVKKMKEGFKNIGLNIGNSQTPIIPIIIGNDIDTFQFWKALFDNGVFTNAVISPAVPQGMSLLRTSYMATHTEEQLNRVLEIFEKLGKQFNLIP